MRNPLKNNKGFSYVLTCVCILVVMMLVAVALQYAFVYHVAREQQNETQLKLDSYVTRYAVSKYYPCLTIENEEPPTLTKYGRMRERYLREHRKILYINLLTSGKLYEHLADIDTSACDMAEYLIKEMARKQGVTEELKGKDMMKWIGLMNNIRACADEIVLNDIVYS